MKFQDNFNMLQWLYNFTNNNKGIKRVEESTIRQSRSKKINIVPAEKRTINLQDKKFKKIDSDDTFYFQTKKVSTPTKKLNDIDEIIHNNANKQNDEVKLERIKEILFKCKKS